MESPVSFTGHQEAREICLRGGKSGFPDVSPLVDRNPCDIVGLGYLIVANPLSMIEGGRTLGERPSEVTHDGRG